VSAITDIADLKQRLLTGKGMLRPLLAATNGVLTLANATSGHFTLSLNPNHVGTTAPGTLQSFLVPDGTSQMRVVAKEASMGTIDDTWLGHFYLLGTVDLTSTSGNRFTHSSTFTRVRRTRFGTADSPISLLPLLYLTAASSTTVAQYTMTYVNQNGDAVTGAVVNALPNAVTNVQALYNIMLDDGHTAVLDVTAITVSTATTGATANLYGFEPLIPAFCPFAGAISYTDAIYGGLSMSHLRPATPDAGAVTSFLGLLAVNNLGSSLTVGLALGVNNT
jgi:hypothetical protein